MYNFRTDLALERREILGKINKEESLDGIETEEKEVSDKIKITKVKITNENGEATSKDLRIDKKYKIQQLESPKEHM